MTLTPQVTETRSSTANEGSLINDIIIQLTPVIQRTVSTAVVQEPAIQRTVSVVQQRPVSSQSTVTVQTGAEDQQGNLVNQMIWLLLLDYWAKCFYFFSPDLNSQITGLYSGI